MAHAAEIAAPPPGGEDLCEPFDAPLPMLTQSMLPTGGTGR
jgi:hypothetical protein